MVWPLGPRTGTSGNLPDLVPPLPRVSGDHSGSVDVLAVPGTPGANREGYRDLGGFQRQLEVQGLTIKRGIMQDASFITADPGYVSADTPRGDQAETRRSRDGTWAKKGSKSQFGYKLHILLDKDSQLIRRIETTTASLHDSRIDLSREVETVYRDKGYFGVKPRASMDKTMHQAVRNHPLLIKEDRRNKAISRTRSLVERPFGVIKRVFHAGHLMVTTVARVRVKNVFSCMNFNFRQLLTLRAQPAER